MSISMLLCNPSDCVGYPKYQWIDCQKCMQRKRVKSKDKCIHDPVDYAKYLIQLQTHLWHAKIPKHSNNKCY
jgi:hypothetical protein